MENIQQLAAAVPAIRSLSITSYTPPSTLAAVVVLSVLESFELLAIGTHLYANYSDWRLNDYVVPVAGVMSTAVFVLALCIAHLGVVGQHLDQAMELTPDRISTLMTLLVPIRYCWILANVLVQLSVIAQFQQYFGCGRLLRRISYVLAILAVLLGLAEAVFLTIGCVPFSALWNSPSPYSACLITPISPNLAFLLVGSADLAVNFLIFVVALVNACRKWIASWWKVCGLYFLFVLGFLACAGAGWRVEIIFRYDFSDFTSGLPLLLISSGISLKLPLIIAAILAAHPHVDLKELLSPLFPEPVQPFDRLPSFSGLGRERRGGDTYLVSIWADTPERKRFAFGDWFVGKWSGFCSLFGRMGPKRNVPVETLEGYESFEMNLLHPTAGRSENDLAEGGGSGSGSGSGSGTERLVIRVQTETTQSDESAPAATGGSSSRLVAGMV